MKKVILILLFGFGTAFADDNSVISIGTATFEKELENYVTAKLITEEQAEEMELNRTDTYLLLPVR